MKPTNREAKVNTPTHVPTSFLIISLSFRGLKLDPTHTQIKKKKFFALQKPLCFWRQSCLCVCEAQVWSPPERDNEEESGQ